MPAGRGRTAVSGPFVVGVGRLLRHPGSTLQERISAPLGGLFVTGSRAVPGSDLTVDVVLESVHGGVMAAGAVEASWEGACRRCLGLSSGRIVAEVRELFTERGDPEESYPLHGDQLDLGPLVRDAVVLGLPLAPLCHEGCRGLCPTCGANLNEGPCDCPPRDGDPRWAVLDALKDPGSAGRAADGRSTRSI